MTIKIKKDIPNDSSWYLGGGVGTEIELQGGLNDMSINTKKKLQKIPIPQTQNSVSGIRDRARNKVIDLKQVEDQFKLRGWIEDDKNETAWNKAWKLRAMCVTLGAITSLNIENVIFDSTTQPVFLESVTIKASQTYEASLDTNSEDSARLEVELNFYLGEPRTQ